MNSSFQRPAPADSSRRSKQVALVLLGTMGVVGGAVVWDAWQRAQPDDPATTEQPSPPASPVAADRTYQNNDYVPGVGYYHAPYRAWFPHPFNFHDPSRGYFAGGLWQAVPFVANLLSSQPNPSAVPSALAAQQRYKEQQRARDARAGFSSQSRSTPASSSFTSRPSNSPSSTPSKPTIQRGGFGSSGKGASGSGSGS